MIVLGDKMDSRERTFLTLEHHPADRIPIDFWASHSMKQKLERGFGITYDRFLDRYDVDLRYISGPDYIGPPLEVDNDIWGVKRITVNIDLKDGTETYKEVAHSPLAGMKTIEEIKNYPGWPSPDWFDYSTIEAQCDTIRNRGRVVVFVGDRLNRIAQFKPAMYLRGMENIFIDIAAHEEIATAIFAKIKEFYLNYLERILEAANGKIDIVLTGDDFGTQETLMISPDQWRRLLKPGFAEYIRLIKNYRIKVMHHTCGSVSEIIPDLIECGLDVLQSIQPEAVNMSLGDLMTNFGDRLCFHGGISIQKIMPFGTLDDIRNEVKRIAGLAGSAPGYIFCTSHNIQADTSIENVQALMEAYLEYGRH